MSYHEPIIKYPFVEMTFSLEVEVVTKNFVDLKPSDTVTPNMITFKVYVGKCVYVSFISATFCLCDWTSHFLSIGFSFLNSRKDSWAEWCQRPLSVSLFLQAWCFSIPKKIWEERKYLKSYKEKINLYFGEECHLWYNTGTMLFSLKLIHHPAHLGPHVFLDSHAVSGLGPG